MKMLLSSASFEADYGGPAVSVSRLGSALAAKGVNVGLWAPNGSAVKSAVIQDVAGVVRLSGKLSGVIPKFGIPDIVHDSGIWLPHNHALSTQCMRLGLCRVVSPRGTLTPWAMRYRRAK